MSLPPLFRFKGGIKPQTHKEASAQLPIASAPLPPLLIVPLAQGRQCDGKHMYAVIKIRAHLFFQNHF